MRILLLLLTLLPWAVSAHAAGETVIRELKNTKIIKSHEQPHNILGEACLACHPKERFDFWLLIYKGKAPTVGIDRLDEKTGEAVAGSGESSSGKPKNKYNSHESIACNFCHFDNPTAATPRFIVDVQELCQLCHPGVGTHRLPEGPALERVSAAITSNKLPGREGKFLCTTCHKLHDATFGIRETYSTILYQGRVPNPHGNRSLCNACHPGRIQPGEEIRFTGGRDINRLCNDCHLRPGVKRAPHVVEVTSSEGTWRMDYLGYPLNQGKVICSTCHDEVSHGKPDPANPNFLRGGPYPDPDRFCYRCHLEDKNQLNNPHRQLDPFGRVREEACRFCHKTDPDPSRSGSSNRTLVADETVICANCHQLQPHPGVDHIRSLTPVMSARREEYEKRHQVTIPLSESGTIQCSTCHNPHGKGVLKGASGVGAGSKWRVADFREVCAPCHGRY